MEGPVTAHPRLANHLLCPSPSVSHKACDWAISTGPGVVSTDIRRSSIGVVSKVCFGAGVTTVLGYFSKCSVGRCQMMIVQDTK